jgi:hypothetical protein
MIPRQKSLELFIFVKLSLTCRLIVLRSLRDTQGECKVVRLKKDSHKLQVHQDIVCFWPRYFETAFSGRWRVLDIYDLDPDNMFTTTSLIKIFEGFFYTGSCKRESYEGYEVEKRIADFFNIKELIL